MLKEFVPLKVKDADLTRIQDAIAKALAPVFAVPFLDGRFVEPADAGQSGTGRIVFRKNQPLTIRHRLKRPLRGWWVMSPAAQGPFMATVNVMADPDSGASPSTAIVLIASDDLLADVWVW